MINSFSLERIKEAAAFIGLDDAQEFKFSAGEKFSVQREGNAVSVTYFKPVQAFRALAVAKSKSGDFSVVEHPYLEHMGYMADVARDAVPKIKTLKKFALNLALMGYDRFYIYLEDLLTVENEPFSGYMRGRYKREELKELDDYCFSLGIELVPCVQTLAHLSAIFRWEEYSKIKDVNDILLIGDDRTYTYIDNVFKELSKTFRSKTVHAGLDEAYMVGLGEYLTRHGFRERFDVMSEHIGKILDLAEKYGFNLQMWSDMFFSIACRQYCNENVALTQEELAKIPKNVTLVYWNYYKSDYNDYAAAIKNHKKLENKIIFAGGAWKWSGFTPSNRSSIERTRAAFSACKDNGVKEIFLTGWGDDGSEASVFSTLPTQAAFAQMNYTGQTSGTDEIFKAVTDCRLEDFMTLDIPVIDEKYKEKINLPVLFKTILYSDPLYGSMDVFFEHFDFKCRLEKALKAIGAAKNDNSDYGYIFDTAYALCDLSVNKCDLSLRIKKHYARGEKKALDEIADKELPELIKKTERFYEVFRLQWEKENSTVGFEVHDARICGAIGRLKNTGRILGGYVKGERKKIPELEEQPLHLTEEQAITYGGMGTYKQIHTVNIS